jgi:3-hydroxyacyl-[acyl-carrier-protein] dehydratase
VDLKKINMEKVLFDSEEICRIIPHRYEMLQIDRIVLYDPDTGVTIGIKEVRDDEFWVRGHIPGRPILPGVLLLEAAAQLCTFHFAKSMNDASNRFFGFAKVDRMKFRGVARPNDMIVFVIKVVKQKVNSASYAVQAFVAGKMIFEAEVMGATV